MNIRLVKLMGSVVMNTEDNWWLPAATISDTSSIGIKDVVSILRVLRKFGWVDYEKHSEFSGTMTPVTTFWRRRKCPKKQR